MFNSHASFGIDERVNPVICRCQHSMCNNTLDGVHCIEESKAFRNLRSEAEIPEIRFHCRLIKHQVRNLQAVLSSDTQRWNLTSVNLIHIIMDRLFSEYHKPTKIFLFQCLLLPKLTLQLITLHNFCSIKCSSDVTYNLQKIL